MLFDIEADSHETRNLAESQAEVAQEGARRLAAWHDEMMKTMPFGYTTDPMDTVMTEEPAHAQSKEFPAYAQRLRETGRGQWLEVIKKRHPHLGESHPHP
ncbi:MAG: hypothetical protein HP493_09100 [Nitrospira sp.]|nr:hypothetical protein [Nitrospira sp.]